MLADLDLHGAAASGLTLEVWNGPGKVGEVALRPPSELPPSEANGPAYSTSAFWARLEAGWVNPGLRVRVRRTDGVTSDFQPIKAGATTPFTVLSLPFYLFGMTEAMVPLSRMSTADPAQLEYAAKHPLSSVSIRQHPAGKIEWPYIVVGPRGGRPAQRVTYKEEQGDGYAVMSAVLNVMGGMRGANGEAPLNNQYFGPLLMANKAGQYDSAGGGLGGGSLATGTYDSSGILIHELGHGFGLPHALDAFNNGSYPYVGGSLKGSVWGYDLNRNLFLPVTMSHACNASHQRDDAGRCVKQDPMQSGAGDQTAGDRFTMFSDYNAAVIQQAVEGVASLKNGKHVYSGGRVFEDSASPTGYSRWDSLDARMVPFDTSTQSNGLYGLDGGLPSQKNLPVATLMMTASIASVADTDGDGKLSYADGVTYSPSTTQIYPPVLYTGNLRRTIDPSDAAQRASVVPNTSANAWYCLSGGCDYTLRVSYADGSTRLVGLQGGFRGWYNADSLPADVNNPAKDASYHMWSVNVPASVPLKRVELLETPTYWKGLPAQPKVVASRDLP